MTHGLNFNHAPIWLFLAFVSYWNIPLANAQTSGQAKDEFSIFENDSQATKKPTTPSEKSAAAKKKSSATAVTEPASNVFQKHSQSPEERIEHLKKEIRSSPKNIGLVTELAEEFYKIGDDEKVTLLLWKYVDKIDRRGLIVLAKAHEKRKESGEMIRALNILIGKDDKDYEAYTLMGNAYVLGRKNKEALESYKKALELNSKYEPAYDGLIALYEKREPPNLYELRILFQDMIDNIGSRPQYLRRLCEINTQDGTYDAAIQVCNEAIIKEPKVADPYVYLGISQRSNGDEDKGVKTLKKAADDFSTSELAQYQYAKVLEDSKNYVDAMKLYKKATEVDAKSSRSWLGLATSSFEIRKYDIALIAYKNACKYDKKNAVAFRKATTVLRNQKNSQWVGKFEDASENCTF